MVGVSHDGVEVLAYHPLNNRNVANQQVHEETVWLLVDVDLAVLPFKLHCYGLVGNWPKRDDLHYTEPPGVLLVALAPATAASFADWGDVAAVA